MIARENTPLPPFLSYPWFCKIAPLPLYPQICFTPKIVKRVCLSSEMFIMDSQLFQKRPLPDFRFHARCSLFSFQRSSTTTTNSTMAAFSLPYRRYLTPFSPPMWYLCMLPRLCYIFLRVVEVSGSKNVSYCCFFGIHQLFIAITHNTLTNRCLSLVCCRIKTPGNAPTRR